MFRKKPFRSAIFSEEAFRDRAELVECLRDLARRGFIERDEERKTNRLHPRWVNAPKGELIKAINESYEQNPSGIVH